ncbi:hypothetical protein E4T44_14767 [Aureobasidium sp. EXF-8845]|nr:hypothetical protein E4T44_14767 [Aureobasidium sp. EXF-8845]KAI4767296.1 hypothetical protein E4T45_14365 [Aureobasidium sp. EXF-8846]
MCNSSLFTQRQIAYRRMALTKANARSRYVSNLQFMHINTILIVRRLMLCTNAAMHSTRRMVTALR